MLWSLFIWRFVCVSMSIFSCMFSFSPLYICYHLEHAILVKASVCRNDLDWDTLDENNYELIHFISTTAIFRCSARTVYTSLLLQINVSFVVLWAISDMCDLRFEV